MGRFSQAIRCMRGRASAWCISITPVISIVTRLKGAQARTCGATPGLRSSRFRMRRGKMQNITSIACHMCLTPFSSADKWHACPGSYPLSEPPWHQTGRPSHIRNAWCFSLGQYRSPWLVKLGDFWVNSLGGIRVVTWVGLRVCTWPLCEGVLYRQYCLRSRVTPRFPQNV